MEFDVQRCSRRCAETDREFRPGESFFSVLMTDGTEVTRRDFSAEAWQGAPDEAIGWWKCRAPEPHAKKPQLAPNDVLLEYFQQLEGQADRQDIRYVLALLMIRRRILRMEDTERDESGAEFMILFCSRNDTEYRVPSMQLTSSRVQAIQDELVGLLYTR